MSDILGFLIFLVSTILRIILFIPIYIYGCYKSGIEKSFGDYNFSVGKIGDIFGNVLGSYIFNDVLIKSGGYKYGNETETISFVTNMNLQSGTLRMAGKCLAWILKNVFKDPAFK